MTRWQFKPIERRSGYHGPAVYKVRLIVDGLALVIPRFLRADRSGILQIGVASDFERRRKQFMRGLRVGQGHSEANLLHMLERRSRLKRVFAKASYEIAWRVFDDIDQALAEEEALIKRYLCRFGEVPPLNSVLPKRYVWVSEVP